MNTFNRKIQQKFIEKRKLFVAYLPVGDPLFEDPVSIAQKLVESGVDIFELGLPYKNPTLDGPIVASSMQRSLQNTSHQERLDIIARIRKNIPDACLQIMTYAEVLDEIGSAYFIDQIKYAGAEAILVPNAKDTLNDVFCGNCQDKEIISLNFSPYNLDEQTAVEIAKSSEGYIFQQASQGKTGVQTQTSSMFEMNCQKLRSLGAKVPVCAGFGISRPEEVRSYINMGADGVIIGSAIIRAQKTSSLLEFSQSIRKELDNE